MKARLSLILFSVLFLFTFSAFSQQKNKIDTITAKYDNIGEMRPIEKVYLQFDRPYYAVGDTMWVSGWVTVGLHQLSALSKIVYVDIINSKDSLVKTILLPVSKGTCAGTIPLLSPLYKQDNYHIKAYTKWMMNFDQAYFFHQTITIGNAQSKDISTLVSFNRVFVNGVPKISADVTFKDGDGKPISNKKMTWYVNKGFESIADGQKSTDQKGVLSISFNYIKPFDLNGAILTTSMETGRNKTYDATFPMKFVANPTDMQFMPEGGNLIAGVPSKVAVKAVAPNGLGIDFTAAIVDNQGNTVATVTSEHAGMGMFILSPQAGKTYKANVDFKDGTKAGYDLPKILQSGITLSINNTDTGKVAIRIMADSTYLKAHLGSTYYLVGRNGQIICVGAPIKLIKSVIPIQPIPSTQFPTGITQFTLLSASGESLSERIVFINHKDELNLTINTDKKVYGPRQKISLDVLSKLNSTPAEASLSISVIDESKIPVNENAETTILSSLLLTSDLQGYVENPNYYFNTITDKTRSDLDLLMLTQGYRRFTLQDVMADKIPMINYLPEQNGIEIAGTLRSRNGMPVKGGRVTLQIPDRYYTSPTMLTDPNGKFKFTNLMFLDTTQVIVNARDNVNAKDLMLNTDGAAYPAVGKNPLFPDEKLNIDTMMNTYLAALKKVSANSNVLQVVEIKAKSTVKAPSFQDNSALAGLSIIDDQVIPADRLKGCNTLLTCIQTLASGVTYDATEMLFYVSRDYNNGNKVPMAVVVDKMFTETTHLNNVNVADLESVEVFLKDATGLVNSANRTNGVIVVNMKATKKIEGDAMNWQQLKNMLPVSYVLKMRPNGYSVAKEFYSPKYLTNSNSYRSDQRTTIYWNPRLLPDAGTGKVSMDFYSADSKGTYRAVVQGIGKDGHLGYSVYRFKVE